ncbi:MAG: GxxExxY protein [Lysobacterales bacterium]
MDQESCSNQIIGAAIEVHRTLGPGLLESAYEVALAHQLRLDGLRVLQQPQLAVNYKGIELPDAYRIDLLVEDLVVVEVKSIDKLQSIHTAQLLTYLRFSGKHLGLLFNFNTAALRHGMQRVVHNP